MQPTTDLIRRLRRVLPAPISAIRDAVRLSDGDFDLAHDLIVGELTREVVQRTGLAADEARRLLERVGFDVDEAHLEWLRGRPTVAAQRIVLDALSVGQDLAVELPYRKFGMRRFAHLIPRISHVELRLITQHKEWTETEGATVEDVIRCSFTRVQRYLLWQVEHAFKQLAAWDCTDTMLRFPSFVKCCLVNHDIDEFLDLPHLRKPEYSTTESVRVLQAAYGKHPRCFDSEVSIPEHDRERIRSQVKRRMDYARQCLECRSEEAAEFDWQRLELLLDNCGTWAQLSDWIKTAAVGLDGLVESYPFLLYACEIFARHSPVARCTVRLGEPDRDRRGRAVYRVAGENRDQVFVWAREALLAWAGWAPIVDPQVFQLEWDGGYVGTRDEPEVGEWFQKACAGTGRAVILKYYEACAEIVDYDSLRQSWTELIGGREDVVAIPIEPIVAEWVVCYFHHDHLQLGRLSGDWPHSFTCESAIE